MDQRAKARDFARREGYGDAAAAVNVRDAPKGEVPHKHMPGRPQPAKAHQAYNGGDLHPVDGLLRGHVKDV